MRWSPITDLPEYWQDLVSTEVASLAESWEETFASLKNTSMVDMFNEKLRREWSIETGIIERIYTIDRGTTQLLIEQGIDASLITHGATNRPVGEVVQIIKDQREALDGLFAFVAKKEKIIPSQTVYWHQGDIVRVAEKLNYYANLTRPRLWVRIKIEDKGGITPTNAEIIVSFHYLGRENRGIMIATAFLTILHPSQDELQLEDDALADTRSFRETQALVQEGFIITYTDQVRLEQRQREFREWLDQAITIGLAEWERQL